MEQIKILIVEDDKMLCTIFKMFIEELGYEIVAMTGNSEEAISETEKHKPDIVLMDIHLEGETNGIETAKILGEKFKTPIIYITGDEANGTFENAILMNTYGFLSKPILKEELEKHIKFAIVKHKLVLANCTI